MLHVTNCRTREAIIIIIGYKCDWNVCILSVLAHNISSNIAHKKNSSGKQVAPHYLTPLNKSSRYRYVYEHDQTLVSSKGGVLAKCSFVLTCYLQVQSMASLWAR